MTKAACLVLCAVLGGASPAAAQFILSENPNYPAGVGDQFPPGAGSVANAPFYAFQVQNLTGVPQAIFQISLSITTIGIVSADISNVLLLQDPCCLVASGTVIGNSIVFESLAGHIVPALGQLRYVLRWDVASLVPGDRAEVDISRSGLVPSATSGDAAPVVHLVEQSIPALGVAARFALAVGLCLVTAVLAKRFRSRRPPPSRSTAE